MGKPNLDQLNSACCRLRGTLLTLEGIRKGAYPELLGGHAVLDGKPVPLTELAEQVEPLLQALLPPVLKELRALQAGEAR